MPECEPRTQRLPDIDHQYGYRPAVADEADDDCRVEDWLQHGLLQDVDEKSGEERARSQCDHAEIEKNPEAESKPVVHVGLIQAAIQAKPGRIDSDCEQRCPGNEPEQKTWKRGARFVASDPAAVAKNCASHVAPPRNE